ncbi:MAG: hypothetical protein DRP87_08890 [Spirochaetes bacterium]|nr:MAG: hypothetical protein DRP87_08890 [Spirochaetota bacterium]
MNRLKVGVIGLGRLGTLRAADIACRIEGAELAAVCDVAEERVVRIGEQYNVSHRFTDYRELLELDDIESVVISNSSERHAEVVCRAMTEGKHIFCEKPIALDKEQLACMERLIRDDLIFQVGFTKRMDGDYLTMKNLMQKGEIGKPVFVNCLATEAMDNIEFYKQFGPESGGMIFDIAIHDIDLVRWFMQSEPISIYAMGGVFGFQEIKQMGDIDNYLISLKLQNGTMAQLQGQRNPQSEFVREVEIMGTKGSLLHRVDTKGLITVSGTEATRIIKGDGGMNAFVFKYRKLYTEELKAFVDCIQKGTHPPANFYDGKIAVEAACDAVTSLKENKVIHRR